MNDIYIYTVKPSKRSQKHFFAVIKPLQCKGKQTDFLFSQISSDFSKQSTKSTEITYDFEWFLWLLMISVLDISLFPLVPIRSPFYTERFFPVVMVLIIEEFYCIYLYTKDLKKFLGVLMFNIRNSVLQIIFIMLFSNIHLETGFN
jgi:hypothetical protein